jgi:hypothetical protein
MATGVYVDGFNLYYGALKGTQHKWLDLEALSRRLLPKDQIVVVRYFTALVSARPSDPNQPVRQQAYLRALDTLLWLRPTLGTTSATAHECHWPVHHLLGRRRSR